MKGDNTSTIAAVCLIIGLLVIAGIIFSEPKCCMSGCKEEVTEGSKYCYLHDLSDRVYGTPDFDSLRKNNEQSKESESVGSNSSNDKNVYSSNTNNNKSTSSKKTYSTYDSYDEGYEDVYMDEDYDWDRYYSDDDYALGVDDAMEDMDW